VKELPVRRSEAESLALVETKSLVVDSYVGVVREVTVKAATTDTKKIEVKSTKRLRTTSKYSLNLKRTPKSG
jgi:hypothetical protein